MRRFDGSSENDRKVWRTYVHLAREHAIGSGGQPAVSEPAFIDDPTGLLPKMWTEALLTVLFSSFALEYRLKRVLSEMCPNLDRKKIGEYHLRTLVGGQFWRLLKDVDRCDGKGRCAPAEEEWVGCVEKLEELAELRNKIAHADYEKVLEFLEKEDSGALARSYYNTVVDAMMLINYGTGYDLRPLGELRDYFRPVKVIEQ